MKKLLYSAWVAPALSLPFGISSAFDDTDLEKFKTCRHCDHCDLTGAVLTGTNFKGASLRGVARSLLRAGCPDD